MWMNLERTVLSKVSQKERKEHRTILCKVKKHSNKYPKATEPKNWSLAETMAESTVGGELTLGGGCGGAGTLYVL